MTCAGNGTRAPKSGGPAPGGLPSYADVVGVVNRLCDDDDRVVTAAGGLPGEVAANWRARAIASVDIEYGYSCMGYEIAGGWGARIAQMEAGKGGDTIVFVGDGSYLMLNSDIYSSVLSGRKLIVILCDNGGFAVIDKLQRNTGNVSFNNLIADCNWSEAPFAVDFVDARPRDGRPAESVVEYGGVRNRLCPRQAALIAPMLSTSKSMPGPGRRAATHGGKSACRRSANRPEVLAATAEMDLGRERQRRGV